MLFDNQIKMISHLLPFNDMSRHGRFEKNALRATCELIYVMTLVIQ